MTDTTREEIMKILASQREYFKANNTKSVAFRIDMLKKFRCAIQKNELKIAQALWTDLHKSYEEAYLTEVSIVMGEIDFHIAKLKKWAKPRRVSTPLPLLPSFSKIIYEPLGVSLIIAPWNYPFQLMMNPLVGAISAGCTAILKPSPYTPSIAKVMEEIIHETFEPHYIDIVQGGREVNKILLDQRFDVIFFTGSPSLGKTVMKAASEHLTPVILELGGKSPCIVDKDADISVAAKRIAWGKTINAGQTCIAPDYLFVHKSVKSELIEKMTVHIEKMFGKNLRESRFYPRIVNDQALQRLKNLLHHGKIIYGGEVIDEQRYISPTIIDEVKPEYPVMQEEIFGPVLPVMCFEEIREVIDFITVNEKPLAVYYFGKNSGAREFFSKTSSGGGCVNDTLLHIVNKKLPFGGVGNSGMGKYHGKESFLAFSNMRSVVISPTWIDIPLKYAPYRFFKMLKHLV